MKGAVWEFWFVSVAILFFGITIFYLMTPFIEDLTTSARLAGNFTTLSINETFHQTLTFNFNLWTLWPLALVGLVLFVIFVAASEEDELEKRGVRGF